jgi:hypothetical protein
MSVVTAVMLCAWQAIATEKRRSVRTIFIIFVAELSWSLVYGRSERCNAASRHILAGSVPTD